MLKIIKMQVYKLKIMIFFFYAFVGHPDGRNAFANFILVAEVPLVQGQPVNLEVERRPGVNQVNGHGHVLNNDDDDGAGRN